MTNNLDTVKEKLQSDDTDKVAVSDELMYELDIWSEDTIPSGTTLTPVLKSKRKNLPVSYELYNISQVSEYSHMIIEEHSKQQGDRYTVPYVIGVGEITLEDTCIPRIELMYNQLTANVKNYDVDVPTPSRKDIEKLHEGIKRTCEWYVNEGFESNIYSMVFDGTFVYITPCTSRWEGMNHIIRDSDIPDKEFEQQLREVQDQWTNKVRGFNSSSRHPFKMEITLE